MNESLHELVELYVLDALTHEENDEFEKHLLSCDACQAELDSYLSMAEELDMLPPGDPSPELKSSVMEAIQAIPQISAVPAHGSADTPKDDLTGSAQTTSNPMANSANVADFAAEKKRRRGVQILAAAAACILAVLGFVVLSGAGEPDFDDIASVADAEFADFDASVEGSLRVVWSESAEDLALSGTGLAQLPDNKVYELWIIADSDPIPAGLFTPDADGNVDFVSELVGDPAVWAVTIEDAAGAEAPTTEPIFVAAL